MSRQNNGDAGAEEDRVVEDIAAAANIFKLSKLKTSINNKL